MIIASFAKAMVRWRWIVIAVWAIVGLIAFIQAPKTPNRLALQGGADEMTEARTADRLLSTRFARPFGEFLAVAVEGPTSFAEGPGRAVLDTLTKTAARLAYVQNVVSYLTRSDTLFVSNDGRTTFFLVSSAFGPTASEPRSPTYGPSSTKYWPKCPTGHRTRCT